MKSILVPIDFSKDSMNALEHAIAMANKVKANIRIVHVRKDKNYDASAYEINYRGRANRDYGSEGGSVARFFYCSKASKLERGENNNHCTVKPLKLMKYLCRLVCPPDGIVLDPFMGSGTTGLAAQKEGFDFIGIERELEYIKIAKARIKKDRQLNLYLTKD